MKYTCIVPISKIIKYGAHWSEQEHQLFRRFSDDWCLRRKYLDLNHCNRSVHFVYVIRWCWFAYQVDSCSFDCGNHVTNTPYSSLRYIQHSLHDKATSGKLRSLTEVYFFIKVVLITDDDVLRASMPSISIVVKRSVASYLVGFDLINIAV